MSGTGVDGLLAILGDSGLTRTAAERLLQQTEGSIETAVAVYFSSDPSTIAQEDAASPLTQLRAILGSSITIPEAERLLARAHNSVQQAVDLYYTSGGGSVPGSVASSDSDDAAVGPSSGVESLVSSREATPAEPASAGDAGQAGLSGGPNLAPAGPSSAGAVRRPRTVGRRQPRGGAPRGLDAIVGVPGPTNAAQDRTWQPARARDLAFLAAAANPTAANGTARRRARPSRRTAGRPPSRFAEAAGAAGGGDDDDDDDSDVDEEDNEDEVMSLDESEDPSVLAVTEDEAGAEGEEAAPEEEPQEWVPPHQRRELSVRPHIAPLLRLKEQAQQEGRRVRALPFPKRRDGNGRLFAGVPDKVPPVMPPSKPLAFPVRLGSLDVDLELRDAETAGLIAIDILEGRRTLVEDQFSFHKHGRENWLLQQAVSGEAEDEKLRCLTSTLDYNLFSTLDNLESAGKIDVLYELRVEAKSGKRKKKKKDKANQVNAQVKLKAQILLKEAAISKDVLQETQQKNNRQKSQYMRLYALILQLLERGNGLMLGPDSDGLLNFCDPVEAQTPEQRQVEEAGKVGASDKGKQRAEEPPEESEEALQPEEVKKPKWQTDIEKLLTSGRLPKDAQLDPVPAQLQSHPKRFQLQGLRWMVTRERNGDAVGRGHLHLHPAWLQLLAADGQLLYVSLMPPHQVTTDFITAPTGGTCGGFLCDMMGLGKTLETLMLVLANPAPTDWAMADMDGRSRTNDADPVPIKTTLIVMPANLLTQWQEELQLHVKPGALTWGVYQGQDASLAMRRQESSAAGPDGARVSGRPRTKMNPASNTWTMMITQLFCRGPDGQPVPLHACDVAFMSYENLRKELGYADKSLLLQYGFWRLVLDEAQLVASSSSVAALMTSALWRRHAWVVTGTPVTSRVEEIQGLLEFLAYEPFYDNRSWSSLVLRRHETGPERLLPLCSLLKGVMLRRTKEDVEGELELLPCTHEDVWVQLSPVERAMYERTRVAVDTGVRASGGKRRGKAYSSAHKKVTARVVGQFTQLRQQCCHPQIVRRDVWLGKTRLSMRQILTRLVTRAFGEYDAALRAEYNARLLLAAVQLDEDLCTPDSEGAAFEMVLRQIEHGMDLSAATDLQQLLGSRDSEGGLPPADLSAPHPFRGSGPGAEPGPQPEPEAEQGERGQKRKADEAVGPSEGFPEAGPSKRSASQSAVTACGAARLAAQLKAAAIDAARSNSAAVAAASAQPAESAGSDEAAPARESAPSSLPNGSMDAQPAASGPAPEDKGKGKAVEVPEASEAAAAAREPDGEAVQAQKAARDRVRQWQRLRLEGLVLLADVLETAEDAHVRKRARKPEDAADAEARLAAIRDDLQQVRHAAESMRLVLGDEEDEAAALGAAMRFSRRQRKMEVDEDLAADRAVEMQEERAAQQRSTQQMLRAYSHMRARAHPIKAAEKGVAAAAEATTERWHALQHLAHKLHSLDAAKDQAAALNADEAGPSDAAGPSTEAEADDIGSCPICLDVCERRTMTACGHHFCSDCIHESVHNRAECPICRAPLRPEDLFDAATEEEEETARLHHENVGQYGAKVTALLTQLAEMRSADGGAKAVVFSAWGRLLKLVGDALSANGVRYVSLAGAQPAARAEALRRFIHDPDCAVILIVLSTGGGAAGLTLTVANTVFLMEPALNPGLEAQAAARIYRLGQTKATRVVRLLAEDTIEASILKYQQRKLMAGGGTNTEDSLLPQQDVDASTLATLMRDHPPPPASVK